MLTRKSLIHLLLVLVLPGVAAVYFFVFTTLGSVIVARYLIAPYADLRRMTVQRVEGNLSQGLSFREVEIRGLPGLPGESVLKAQSLSVAVDPLQIWHSRIQVQNGRLGFTSYDYPVVLSGAVKNGLLDFNVYSKSINVGDFLDLFSAQRRVKIVSGTLADFDGYLRGAVNRPVLTGAFLVEKFSYREFLLTQSLVSLELRFAQVGRQPKLYGRVLFKSGTITSRSATVQLEPSEISFSGPLQAPRLNVKGTSTIEGVKIFATLQGTVQQPELHLVSEPPLSQEVLLLMLSTGKRWRNAETGVPQGQGEIPLVLARDFIDYLLFSGLGTELAEKYGLSNVSLTYDAATQGVGLRTTFSDRAEIRYGLQQPPQDLASTQTSPTQKVGVEYKITDKISVEAESKLKSQQPAPAQGEKEQVQQDGQVVLKYRKKF